MDNKDSQLGLGSSVSAINNNIKLTKFVADWWSAACYLRDHLNRFEPNEKEAFEYIFNTPARGSVDEDKFVESQNIIREIAYNSTDKFGEQAKDFAGKSGKILKNISAFAETLESVKQKATTDVNINRIRSSAAYAGANQADNAGRRTIRGDVWEGTFDASGIPYGSGTIHYADGSVYTGQWSAAGPHGNGKIVKSDGDVWTALFRDGKPVDGQIQYANGNRYEGGLNDYGRNGIGKTFTESFEEYGQYADDSRTGRGKIVFRNGDFYEGGWNDNGPHGRGSMFDSVNKRTDTGEFLNGKRNGRGRMVWAETSTCYEGTWRDTPMGMEGEGITYILPNGRRSPVRYVNGRPISMSQAAPQPPYNSNVKAGYVKEPSGYGLRNFLGIAGGLFFGFLMALAFIELEFWVMFFMAMFVTLSQFLFMGKFNPRTGVTTRRTFGSPVAITGYLFIFCSLVELSEPVSVAACIFGIIIGIILIIFAVRK